MAQQTFDALSAALDQAVQDGNMGAHNRAEIEWLEPRVEKGVSWACISALLHLFVHPHFKDRPERESVHA